MEGKCFSVSHDQSIRVWDITGIDDDSTFGGSDKDKNKGNKPARVDDNQNNVPNGNAKIKIGDDDEIIHNGGIWYDSDTDCP